MVQRGRPRVCFACAAALAMVTEGQPGACSAIEREGGIQALVQLLVKGGGQGKKVPFLIRCHAHIDQARPRAACVITSSGHFVQVAAEALQALAAESEAMRPKITATGCIKPLVQMLQIGEQARGLCSTTSMDCFS